LLHFYSILWHFERLKSFLTYFLRTKSQAADISKHWFPFFPGVNFINILHAHFSYESLLSSFSLPRIWLQTNFHTKNARVKSWWNWPQHTLCSFSNLPQQVMSDKISEICLSLRTIHFFPFPRYVTFFLSYICLLSSFLLYLYIFRVHQEYIISTFVFYFFFHTFHSKFLLFSCHIWKKLFLTSLSNVSCNFSFVLFISNIHFQLLLSLSLTSFIYSIYAGGPHYMQSFYLQICVFVIEKWPFFWNLSSNLQWSLVFLYSSSLYASIFLESISL